MNIAHPFEHFLGRVAAVHGGAEISPVDQADLKKGAQYVPGEVSGARKRGVVVTFHQSGATGAWFWRFPDGKRIYHGQV